LTATVSDGSSEHVISGDGNGPIDAFVHALNEEFGIAVRILDYDEHAVGSGAGATAVSFVELRVGESDSVMGVGMHRNILTASLNAITSALNRAIRDEMISAPRSSVPAPPVSA
jgi:2-isopropylmalate synthase